MRCESPQSTHGLVAGDKSLLFFVFPSIDTIRSSSDKLWIWILRVLKWCSETIDENELGLVGQAGAHFPYFIHPLGRARLSRSPVRHKKVRKSERAKERKTEGESGHKLAMANRRCTTQASQVLCKQAVLCKLARYYANRRCTTQASHRLRKADTSELCVWLCMHGHVPDSNRQLADLL